VQNAPRYVASSRIRDPPSFDPFRPSSKAEKSKHSLSLLCASSLPPTPGEVQSLGSLRSIGYSGPSCHGSGRDGKRISSSSSPTQSSAGTARVFGSTGDPSRGRVLDDLRSRSKCRLSFVDSRTRTVGEPEKSERNSRSWVSPSASPPCLDISQSEIPTTINASGRRRSFAITVTASPRWTPSSSPPFGSTCCTSGL